MAVLHRLKGDVVHPSAVPTTTSSSNSNHSSSSSNSNHSSSNSSISISRSRGATYPRMGFPRISTLSPHLLLHLWRQQWQPVPRWSQQSHLPLPPQFRRRAPSKLLHDVFTRWRFSSGLQLRAGAG